MSGTPEIASYSILRAEPGETYAVVVWGSRSGVERCWTRIPSYWSSDTDSSSARGAWMSVAGVVAGVVPVIVGLIDGTTGVPSTGPAPIPNSELGRFEGARAGDYYCVFLGSPTRGSSNGFGMMLAEDMKWDFNAQGARDCRFAIVSPTSRFGSEGDRTNDALATRDSVRQTWTDTARRASDAVAGAVDDASETVSNTGSLLTTLSNPWVLIPVALAGVAIAALFVVVPAVLQVRVNR